MKKKNLVIIAAAMIVFNLFFVNLTLADLYVRPAKLGILRLTVSPFFPAKATGSFDVGNTYNHSISITLIPSKDIAGIISLSEDSFTLQPNETRKIDYIITVTEPGTYTGNVQITTKAADSRTWVGYQADIVIIASKSNFDPTNLIVAAVVILAVALILIYIKILKKGKLRGHIFTTVAFCFATLFFFSSNVLAANVAMVVKDATALSPEHEQTVFNILTDAGHNVTLVDKNIDANYYDYNLIVVAGRPLISPGLDDFVANIPVNNIPTIVIDYSFLNDWGWVSWGGVISHETSQTLKLYIKKYHPITQGFSPGDIIFARTVAGRKAVGMSSSKTNFTFAGTTSADGYTGLVAYAPPKTQLAGGKRIADDSAAIFIGVTYPAYWSTEMTQIFENSVNWLLNLEYEPPTVPVLSSTQAGTSAIYTWTASSDTSGIQYYQFQLSQVADFSSTIADVYVTELRYAASSLRDGSRYYARVRAIDNIDVPSDWSNVVAITVDFTNIVLQTTSPTEGTILHVNDTINVNANVVAPRLVDGSFCTVSIAGEPIANITYNKATGKCSGSVAIPTNLGKEAIGATSFTVSATNSLGSTNSTSVAIFMDRQLGVSFSTAKTSYTSGENITFSGYVTVIDNGAKVENALVSYSVSGMTGNKQTDSNGFYSFSFNNITAGTYTASVNAAYRSVAANNSALFSVFAPSTSSSSSSSSNSGTSGSILAPILTIAVPDKITAYENSDQQISARVKNEGTILIHSVKLVVSGIGADVQPNLVDLGLNNYQDFKITLHVPAGTGEKQITVKALGYETTREKKLTLTIFPQTFIPDLRMGSIELPTFAEGEQTTVIITVVNAGNATASASASIELPTGWVAAESQKTFEITANSQEKISFSVTPSSESGQITFSVNYLADDQEKQISETRDVTSKPKEMPMSITGMLVSAITRPEFYIPVPLVVFAASIYLLRKKGFIRHLRMPVKPSESNGNNFHTAPRRKINLSTNYLEWERKRKYH